MKMLSTNKSNGTSTERPVDGGVVDVPAEGLFSQSCSSTGDSMPTNNQDNDQKLKQNDDNTGDGSITLAFPPRPSNKVVIPKYVVRPGPVAPAPKYVLTECGTHHALDRVIWLHVFGFLTKSELACCMRVCKTWNRWCLDSYFWRQIDLSLRIIRQNHLVGVVRRQPRELNFKDSVISKKQLAWLISRLPHLKVLNLHNNTWAATNALCSSACPLLERLDLSWVNGIWDDCIRDLVSPPTDHRPGVDESISRLHRCSELLLTGTNITDQALEVIGTYMPHLAKLDLSYCSAISDKGLAYLSDDGAVTKASMRELILKYLNQLTDDCFTPLGAFTNIQTIDLYQCLGVTLDGCQRFAERSEIKKYTVSADKKITHQT